MKTCYKIRSSVLFLFFCFGYCIIVASLYCIQIKRRNFFIQLGQQQYEVTVKQLPPRGIIYDTNNKILTFNQDSFSAFILPNHLENIEQLEPFLKKHFPAALQRLHANPQASFMYVKRKLSSQEMQLLTDTQIMDIKLLKEPSRFYPEKSLSQIIGVTDIDNNGLFGLELLCNKKLTGYPTTYCLQKDARSGHFYFKKETMIEGIEGESITLTLDADLQFLAYQELKQTVRSFNAQEGSVLVIDLLNNHILAMVNYPTFDPNNITALEQEKTKNKILTETYELGSVMKAFAALALIEEQLIEPDELIDCENSTNGNVNGTRFTTVKAHGIIAFCDVIRNSNNIGIAKTALRLGSRLHHHYSRLGFGKRLLFEWPGQQNGFLNPPHKWSRSSLISLSFGYEVRATLLHLAQAFSIIAHGGKLLPFKLIKNAPQDMCSPERLYSEPSLQILKTIVSKTNAKPIDGYTIWGKTGTANLLVDGHYSPEHNIYTFAGVVEKDNFKKLIITFIKDTQRKDLRAATVAVPLFDRIAYDLTLHETINTQGIEHA